MVFRLLGPGLVTGAADDDPSGIATYSQAGAQFGYGLLWTVFLTTPFMIAIQLVSGQIGRVTGKGLAANVMELAPRWLVLALVFLLVAANTFNIAADIAAMGEALSLVIGGLNHEHALIFSAISVLLQVFVPYRRYAPVLKFMTLTLFAYVATALTVNIPWSAALLATIWPRSTINTDYFLMVVAVLGTTISPYLFFWQASQEVEEMNKGKNNGKTSRPLRELRRVTRPGGRVVIVLNGPDHLQELRAIVAQVRGEEIWGQQERLRLDGGEVLARPYFPTVTRHDFVSELQLPDPAPIEDYVRSMSGTKHSADPERLVASVVSRFPAGPGAVFTVTTHAGCLICAV